MVLFKGALSEDGITLLPLLTAEFVAARINLGCSYVRYFTVVLALQAACCPPFPCRIRSPGVEFNHEVLVTLIGCARIPLLVRISLSLDLERHLCATSAEQNKTVSTTKSGAPPVRSSIKIN